MLKKLLMDYSKDLVTLIVNKKVVDPVSTTKFISLRSNSDLCTSTLIAYSTASTWTNLSTLRTRTIYNSISNSTTRKT